MRKCLLAVATSLLPAWAFAQAPHGYTAQAKPRIAVMKFENTNEVAKQQGYGESVSAMLVTFLKRKSQFVVVERENLDKVLQQWRMQATGATKEPAKGKALLERIDAILEGKVTVLGTGERQEMEIDARLIGDDAHIISAGQQSGPIWCLRQTVEALGIELEQGFLRPYYGTLTVTVKEPTNVRIFLTPVNASTALADEKPPVELDRTVSAQGQNNVYEKWITVPNVTTIGNLLVGWYTIRLERPGFEPALTDNGKLVIQDVLGQQEPMRTEGGPPSEAQKDFLIQIRPLETTRWPAEGSRTVALRKKSGSLALSLRREFLDADYGEAAGLDELKTFVEGAHGTVEMNSLEDYFATPSDSEGRKCGESQQKDQKLEKRTECALNKALASFDGGPFLREEYHKAAAGEARRLPAGGFTVKAWLPDYTLASSPAVDVFNKVEGRAVLMDLKRLRGRIDLLRVGDPDSEHRVFLEGRDTRFRKEVPLDFRDTKPITDLPVDTYTVRTDISGFKDWKRTVVLRDRKLEPPVVDTQACVVKPAVVVPPTAAVALKTQPWLAGRAAMNRFRDVNVGRIDALEVALDRVLDQEEERAKAAASRQASKGTAVDLLVPTTKTEDTAQKDKEGNASLLRALLQEVDLVHLNDRDTRRLARLPELAAVFRAYLEGGGAVFAFVSEAQDYTPLFGNGLPLTKPVQRGEIELRPGATPQFQVDMKLDVKVARSFPTVATETASLPGWTSLAYRKRKQKEPAIVERRVGPEAGGGYVLVWIDSLDSLSQGSGMEEVLGMAEKRALAWGQFLMFYRYGQGSPELRSAADKLQTLNLTFRKEWKEIP